MDYTKVCEKCNVEKSLDNFGNLSKGKGQKIYKRNICKDCMREQRKDKNKGIEYKPKEIKSPSIKIDEDKKPDKIERDFNMFTSREIEILKNIASKNNELMAILNNKIELEKIEDIKIKKSISISETINNKILELSKNTNLNYSQVLESLVKKALENM